MESGGKADGRTPLTNQVYERGCEIKIYIFFSPQLKSYKYFALFKRLGLISSYTQYFTHSLKTVPHLVILHTSLSPLSHPNC